VFLTIENVEINDPSMASINYFEYRSSYVNQAESDLGGEVWRNVAGGNIIIW